MPKNANVDAKPQSFWPQQSPIDLSESLSYRADFGANYFAITYPDEKLSGKFEDHSFVFDRTLTAKFDGQTATLKGIHIHSPSEHLVDGGAFDFEIHFVHALRDKSLGSTYLVIGVLFREDSSAKTPPRLRL